jgi:hypothetical protein
MRLRPEVHRLEGSPRAIAAAIHWAAIAQELRVHRILDAVAPKPSGGLSDARQITALVKTFERPHVLRRLLDSIRRLYPELPVVVVDDSREPGSLPGVQTIAMPYDSGISAGRNEGLRHVETPYVLVLDDDFVFYRHTALGPALATMEQHPEIDIMGGKVIDLPLMRARRLPEGDIFDTTARPRAALGSMVGDLRVVDKVPTFYLARRDRLSLVGWDPQLKRADHADFFTRALGVLTTVSNPDLRCLHARTPFDANYMSKRMDLGASFEALEQRYGR